MMLCPSDGKPCCDDLCHGGGCMYMEGYEMLEECQFCKGTIDRSIPECSTCTCDDDEYPHEEEDGYVAMDKGGDR